MDMNQYRVLSIRVEDYDTIMNWGFPSAYTGAEVVAELVKYYRNKILADKEAELQYIYYASDEHKKLFEKHLKIDQFSNYKSDNLVCFYINSFFGMYVKDLDNPMEWVGSWNEDHTKFKESAKYKRLKIDKKRLVDYANVLLYETDPLSILKVFSHIENENVVLAQEMLRLKILKL
ncbi:hypothetical protein PO902_06225 [Planococcus maritimus]|nr:hypothetical protein [Planococcus sp. SK3692]MDE4084645.1 hypothetical protein [Planococcus maritimus]